MFRLALSSVKNYVNMQVAGLDKLRGHRLGKLSGFSKFFVNRSNEANSRRFFDSIHDYLTLSNTSNCLELGSGEGFLSWLVYERFRPAKIVVTDYDPSQVDEARKSFEGRLGEVPSSIEFRSADAMQLPFENGAFDAVFAMMVLHHTEKRDWDFRNVPKALDEVRRVLKPNGSFCYTELFNKKRIRSYLVDSGFQRILAERRYLFFDSCVYQKMVEPQPNNGF